jgi:DNA-binding MarR family transcriptional regulator
VTAAIVPHTSNDLAGLDLAGREQTVVRELGRFGDARIAFQGLRRRLGLHPQALTRTLRSLERAGIVGHDERGYFVSPKHRAAFESSQSQAFRPVFAAILPPHVEPKHLAEQLSRRWFQGLRWFGITEQPGEFVLHWILDADLASVRLRITPRGVGLELENGANGLPFEAAAPILQAVATYYGRPALVDEARLKLPSTAG